MLQINGSNPQLIGSRMVTYPSGFDPSELEIDKTVSFISYCAKAECCPASDDLLGRKNRKCIKVYGGKCDVPCSLGNMVTVLRKHGYARDQIFIIDSESFLFDWLKKRREDGHKYIFPGVACPFAIEYALDYIGGTLGYRGGIVLMDDFYGNERRQNRMCRGPSYAFVLSYLDLL